MLQLGVCWRGRTPCQEVGALLLVSIRRGSGQLLGTWGLGPALGGKSSLDVLGWS